MKQYKMISKLFPCLCLRTCSIQLKTSTVYVCDMPQVHKRCVLAEKD